jgi:hypothetical protein
MLFNLHVDILVRMATLPQKLSQSASRGVVEPRLQLSNLHSRGMKGGEGLLSARFFQPASSC